MPRLFCFGLGYSALVFARQLRAEGWDVAGTCRTAEKIGGLRGGRIDAHRFDGTAPLERPDLFTEADAILISAPPNRAGDPVLIHHAGDLAAAAKRVRWVGYLSTTGVYGDHDGAWVDETTPLAPASERSKARAEAEAGWLALGGTHGLPVHIFRLAGIYGPRRNALHSLKTGTARRVFKEGQMFSRIHVDDIAGILAASLKAPAPGTVYNVCDNEPAPPQDVVAYAAELLGVEPPPLVPLEEADLSPMGRSFYAENKKVRNDRLQDALGYSLLYPTYREGLQALLKTLQ
ncbi:MAG: SDR family oxidoreductase [Pseudomonadota bacterium]